jgi:hypothetical protein
MVVVVVMVVMVVMRTGAKHPRAVVPIVAVLQIPAPAMVMMVVMMMVMGGDKRTHPVKAAGNLRDRPAWVGSPWAYDEGLWMAVG